jgi:hypothetical protein
MPYGLLAQFVLMALVGGAMLHWSGPLADVSIAWSANLLEKYPVLRRLPGTSDEFNRKYTQPSVCIAGAILLAGGVSLIFGVFLTLLFVRFHFLRFGVARAVVLNIFVVILLLLFYFSPGHRPRAGRSGSDEY